MKLIVAGASGFVATEIIRQSLSLSAITAVIAVARRPVSAPSDLEASADASKLRSVVINDYGEYSDDVKAHFAGADACIWTVAVTPTKSRSMDFELVRQICQDYPLIALKAMVDARESAVTPFRIVYMSGVAAERDQSKTPFFMPEYTLMRGRVENDVLAFASQHQDKVQACVVKPGVITKPGVINTVLTSVHYIGPIPQVGLIECVAAMLDQLTTGFEKDVLFNDDLVRIGGASVKK